ncbi:unnamed protein product [Linum tenue]|uniref:Cation/H+ exchanger domain-containing protein n=1 Tax=Linum tenue TaxID=586396 RepID=A0AAV0L6M1_9ROSI|nr:unnamed protein product [Linum tenue]
MASETTTVEGWTSGVINVCLNESIPTSLDTSVFWKLARPENENNHTFIHYVPYYFVQFAAILFGINVISAILKPLRFPRFSVELLAGILIGQGLRTWARVYAIPTNSLKVLDTLGHASLIYYVFLVGLEIDLRTVRHIGKEAVYTGLTGTILPLFVGFVEFFVMAADPRYTNFFSQEFWENLAPVKLTGPVFWGVALTVTSFPDLARILSDTKLLHTDMGRLALSSSIISELTTWILLVIALTLNNGTLNPLYLLPTFAFFAASWFLVRPAVTWFLRHADETDNKLLLNFTIFGGILSSSIITEACGANSMIGAFVFGLVIPSGDVYTVKLMEIFEEYVKGILMPVFFMDNGVRSSLAALTANSVFVTPPHAIFLLVVLAWSAKIVGTFVFSKLSGMSSRDAFTLGVLMNTKGVLALVVINTGRNNQGFSQVMFLTLVLSMLFMSVTIMPLVRAANKSTRKSSQFKRRTMESNKLESELRVLACIHTTRNLSGMVYLLESSNGSKQYPISVFALHLVQLTDRRATAMLIVHDNSSNHNKHNNNISRHSFEGSGQNLSRREEESQHIIMTFESLENRGASVSAQSLTVVSPYATMHEDITCLGEDKRVTLILVPFHKQADVYGRFQDENTNWRTMNKNLMATTTCSIGILVDRGLGSSSKDVTTTSRSQSSFVVIFIGGPDDREALAYGWRMAKSPNVNLTMLRLLSVDDDDDGDGDVHGDNIEDVTVERGGATMRSKRDESELDDEYVNEFRFRTMQDESIKYVEKQVKSGDEVITMIGRVVTSCDLYILGQSKNVRSSIMSGLSEWTEYDELGVLGDTLMASEFAQRSSLLVLKQHYVPGMRMWIRRDGDNSKNNDNGRVSLAFSSSNANVISNDVRINRPPMPRQ